MSNVKVLDRARIPIVKFTDPTSRINCDICVNNTLALSNTRLISDYARIDSRFRLLGYTVKYWAKRRAINEPYSGTLSSYTYLLMVIFYLQRRQPPVLPCLQALAANVTPRVIVEGYDCTYANGIERFQGFGSANRESPAELFIGFLRFFAYEFDYFTQVVSPRTGLLLSKQEKDWAKSEGKDKCFLTIEDPFEITHNLGRSVDRQSVKVIRWELENACQLLSKGASYERVCKAWSEQERADRQGGKGGS